MFLGLPLTISLSQVLTGLAISDWIWPTCEPVSLVVTELFGAELSLDMGGGLRCLICPQLSFGLKANCVSDKVRQIGSTSAGTNGGPS